jgi:hypothetical protein
MRAGPSAEPSGIGGGPEPSGEFAPSEGETEYGDTELGKAESGDAEPVLADPGDAGPVPADPGNGEFVPTGPGDAAAMAAPGATPSNSAAVTAPTTRPPIPIRDCLDRSIDHSRPSLVECGFAAARTGSADDMVNPPVPEQVS